MTLWYSHNIIKWYSISEVMKLSPRTGRPKVDNPKEIDIKVRLDHAANNKLLAYCKKYNLTRAEVMRKGLMELLSKEK